MIPATKTWNNPARWANTHLVLSLDVATPLYGPMRLPFAEADAFQATVREHVRRFYLEPSHPGASLEQQQGAMLVSLDNAIGDASRRSYFRWYASVFIDSPNEHGHALSRWQTIFLRSAAQDGAWPRLQLPADKSDAIESALLSCRIEREEAYQLTLDFALADASEWDARVLQRLRIGRDSVANGEPFNRLILTANRALFLEFWDDLLHRLTPIELDHLWAVGRALAPSLELDPAQIEHPARIMQA